MKKGIFSFTTIFTFSLVVIFLTACSNNKETESAAETSEPTEESLTNETDTGTITEIDYSDLETDQTEKKSLTVKDTRPNSNSNSNNKKPTPKKPTVKQPINTNPSTTEAAPSQPKTNNVETAPKKPSILKPSNDNVEAAPKKTNSSKLKLESKKFNKKTTQAFSHSAWNSLLSKHVTSAGKVNYTGFRRDHSALKSYLDLLSKNDPAGKSRNDQIAFWINAYNAHTVDLIVENYQTTSILKLDNGKTWSVKRITIGGKKYSLEDIEKNILIGKFNEARIHFAINCAAKSCPPLKNKAWEGRNLNSDLDRASRNFINNSSYNQIEKKTANLSQIFNWYKGDFNDVNAFINKYANTQITSKTKVNYNQYNWDLNN